MALVDTCNCWSKLGSATAITIPEIGTGAVITGNINYNPAKFDKGCVASAPGSNYFYLTFNSFTDDNKIIIDCWVKPTVNKSSTSNEALFGLWLSNTVIMKVYMQTSGIYCFGYNNATLWNIVDSNTNWVANQLIHIAVIIDSAAGFDGSKTVAIYVDGVQVASSTVNFNFANPWTRLHGLSYYSGTDQVNDLVNVDNIKSYNYINNLTEVLDNRNNEGFPVDIPVKNYYFNSEIVKSKSLSTPIIKDGYFNSDIVKSNSLSTPILKEANFNSEIVKSMDLDTPIE